MRLNAWMTRERYSGPEFMRMVNAILTRNGHRTYSLNASLPWRMGKVVPRPPVVAAIAEITKGEVLYIDHVAENAPFRKGNKLKVPQ